MSIQITQTIEQIELLEEQLGKLEKDITAIMQRLDSVLLTVPGIGYLILQLSGMLRTNCFGCCLNSCVTICVLT